MATKSVQKNTASKKEKTGKPGKLSDRDREALRKSLLALRDQLDGTVSQLRSESLTRDDEVNPEEDGSDAFERLFSLERASSDQDIIFKIDEALRALADGTYGICETCDAPIEKARLQALPFAQMCVRCQSESERMHGGYIASRHPVR